MRKSECLPQLAMKSTWLKLLLWSQINLLMNCLVISPIPRKSVICVFGLFASINLSGHACLMEGVCLHNFPIILIQLQLLESVITSQG